MAGGSRRSSRRRRLQAPWPPRCLLLPHECAPPPPWLQANLVEFNTWLAAQAHTLGMGIGLKNGVDMVPQLHPHFDW